MTLWFLDSEFDEDGKTIELISIALVSNEGHEYYAVSSEFDPNHCNDWVKQNVLPRLGTEKRKSRQVIASEIRELVLEGKMGGWRHPPSSDPEFYGYFADYDWVLLCQLYGRMIDLPKGFPMYCNDVKQLMALTGVRKADIGEQAEEYQHNAFHDVQWIRSAYLYIHSRFAVTSRSV